MRSEPSRSEPSRRLRRIGGRVALYALLVVLATPFVFPVYWMAVTGLKPLGEVFANPPSLFPAEPQWGLYLEPFRRGPFARQLFNSAYIAVLVTLGTLAVSSLAGYAFARIRFRGSSVIFVVLLSALLVPVEVTIIPLFRLMNAFGWINSHLPLILLPIFGGGAILGTFLMRQFFLSLPVELEEAGRVDGLGRFGLFWHIALPLARAPLAALAILAFLTGWNEFLEPLVFLRDVELFTLPLALNSYTDPASGIPIWNVQMAATTISVLPVLVAFFLAQRQFIQGIAGTGVKG